MQVGYKLVDGTALSKVDSATEAGREGLLGWFSRILPHSFFTTLKQDLAIVEKVCVFNLRVTTWMMILQRLSPRGSLDSALSELLCGNGRELLEACKRVREDNISPNTGGYNRARQRMPEAAARGVARASFEQLYALRAESGLRDRLFLLDGSSIQLAHAPAVLQAYPAAQNQHGASHWPVLRVAVMHHVPTALAMDPQFGPMYGDQAVSEQMLAEPLIDVLPPQSVLIADRNFGVFSVMWHVQVRSHKALVRLSEPRARSLGGGQIRPGEYKVLWTPTGADRRGHPSLPAEAGISGRLIIARPAGMKEPLYLFTTLEEPADEVIALYKERWNIETDLRSIKDQVRLHTITAQSPKMVACELLIAIAAYNFVRAVMTAAARQAGVEPRNLSFSRSRNLFWAFVHAAATSHHDFDKKWRRLLPLIARCTLYKRSRPPAPRAVWLKRQNFPSRKAHK